MFGRRIQLNTYTPSRIGVFTQKIPQETGLTSDYFINHTTAFPYFAPFLTQKKTKTFLEYMKKPQITGENDYFSLGTGKLRQPKNLHLRFCRSCSEEDVRKYGETYWRRLHQMQGVLMCPLHAEPLANSRVLTPQAGGGFFPTSDEFAQGGTSCGSFTDKMAKELIGLAADAGWLLQNGALFDGSENTYDKYDSWLRTSGFRAVHGRTWQKKIYKAVRERYGDEFLKLIDAYDEYDTSTWIKRILFYPEKIVHPMYHLLFIRLLAGSAQNFFEIECEKPLPYGNGPWPCRNPICPNNRQDVIVHIEMRYERGFYRTLFQCPHCGFAYRRKKPIPKERQYDEHVYVAEYGHLWEAKLSECLVDRGMSTRRACEFLQCDLYTVNKYAVKLGILKPEDVTFLEKRKKKIPQEQAPAVLTPAEERAIYRKQWLQLIQENPNAPRSLLMTLNHACYLWLRNNDLRWYEQHSPNARYVSMDWAAKDDEIFVQVQAAITLFRNIAGKPRWINTYAITTATGLYQLRNKKAMERLPKTSAYLSETLETVIDWRKRKIVWAINKLIEDETTITPYKISVTASISSKAFLELQDFAVGVLDKVDG